MNNKKIYVELTDSRVFDIRHVREGDFVVFNKVMHKNIKIVNCIDPICELHRHLKSYTRELIVVAQLRKSSRKVRSKAFACVSGRL